MRLPDFSQDAELNRLRQLMNAPVIEYSGASGLTPITAEELHVMATDGIEVPIDAIVAGSDGALRYRNKKVIVYIRDVSLPRSGEIRLPKYHLSMCTALLEAAAVKRYKSRYVVSTRRDGLFVVNLPNPLGGRRPPSTERLQVCKYCLGKLQWHGYSIALHSAQKQKLFEQFSLDEYFSMNQPQLLPTPVQSDITAPINDYPSNWHSISLKLRREVNFTCQNPRCSASLPSHPWLIDVHHIDGNRSNNDRPNLHVLCVKCHSEQPMHQHMAMDKRLVEYKAVIGARRNIT